IGHRRSKAVPPRNHPRDARSPRTARRTAMIPLRPRTAPANCSLEAAFVRAASPTAARFRHRTQRLVGGTSRMNWGADMKTDTALRQDVIDELAWDPSLDAA